MPQSYTRRTDGTTQVIYAAYVNELQVGIEHLYANLFFPEDYGTVGSGNDTAAIQGAIDAAYAVTMNNMKFQDGSGVFQNGLAAPGSGKVMLTRPVYDVTNLILRHRTDLEGLGWGVQVRQIAASTGPVIYNQRDTSAHAKYTRLANFSIRGNRANQTSGTNHGVSLLGNATNNYADPLDEDYDECHRIESMYIWDCKGDGIHLDGAGGNFVRGCKIRNSDGNGMYLGQDNNIENCDIGWSGLAGLVMAGDSSRITNVKCWFSGQITAGSGRGFYITADEGVLSACTAQDNTAQGFLFDSAYNVAATSCSAQQNSKSSTGTYAGFDFYNSKYNVLIGTVSNRYNASAPLQTVAIAHTGGSDYNDIMVVAGRAGDLWQTSTALSSGSTKLNSRIFVNGVTVAPGASV